MKCYTKTCNWNKCSKCEIGALECSIYTDKPEESIHNGSVINCLYGTLVAVLIVYFAICAIGKREEIDATRLHIKVLKLQLLQLQPTKGVTK